MFVDFYIHLKAWFKFPVPFVQCITNKCFLHIFQFIALYYFFIGNCTADYVVQKNPFLRHKTKFLSVLRMLKIPWHSRKKSGSINSQEPLAKYPWKDSFSSQHWGLSLLGILTVEETLYIILINKTNEMALSLEREGKNEKQISLLPY